MKISTKDEHEYIDTHATIEKQFKDVTKQEFDEFIASYPRHLERDVCCICDPPVVSYNDWEIGLWSRSIVASTMLYSDDPKNWYYEPEDKRVYRIVTNYEDLRKEAQMLLREHKREQLRKELLDEFSASGETDYAHWLEYKIEIVCDKYAKQISWLEGQHNAIVGKFNEQINAYSIWLKSQIGKVIIDNTGAPIYESIEKNNAYKDCLLEFDKNFLTR